MLRPNCSFTLPWVGLAPNIGKLRQRQNSRDILKLFLLGGRYRDYLVGLNLGYLVGLDRSVREAAVAATDVQLNHTDCATVRTILKYVAASTGAVPIATFSIIVLLLCFRYSSIYNRHYVTPSKYLNILVLMDSNIRFLTGNQ